MNSANKKAWERRRKRVHEIVEVGYAGDIASQVYDWVGTVFLLVNLAVAILETFSQLTAYASVFSVLENITVAFFAIDYVLRVWAAPHLYPDVSERQGRKKYLLSFSGIVDLFSFLPHYLPVVFPAGTAVFRMFRVVRILRLFQINAYYNSIYVITEVISSKKQQLLSSVFIILVLMVGSSLCMYSLEHEAQPDVFSNAFSGIWWAVSTLLTVGYGDIYPITPLGQLFSIVITFLGVGMVAIPTGIISAGFVDQYSRLKRMSEYAMEENVHFIKVQLDANDRWTNKAVKDLGLPERVIVAMIRRGRENIVPRGDVVLKKGDTLIIGAEGLKDDRHIDLKEVVLLEHNPWNDQYIRDLDISRQTIIVMVRRGDVMLVPRGSLMLKQGDHVILYTQERLLDASIIQV